MDRKKFTVRVYYVFFEGVLAYYLRINVFLSLFNNDDGQDVFI